MDGAEKMAQISGTPFGDREAPSSISLNLPNEAQISRLWGLARWVLRICGLISVFFFWELVKTNL